MGYFRKAMYLFVLGALVSCSKDKLIDTVEPDESADPEVRTVLTATELEFINEYEYVTFNFAPDSFGADKNEKWEADIKVFLDGDIPESYRLAVTAALQNFTGLFNGAITCTTVDSLEESNVHLIFGEKQEIATIWPDMYGQIQNANFKGYALYNRDGAFNIIEGRIWLELDAIPLFNHELGHVIGLGHASNTYCDGNFANNKSFMCSFLKDDFSAFDKAIIQTLYRPEIETGLIFSELRPTIEELLLTGEILVE